ASIPQAAGSWEMYIPTTAGNWTTFFGVSPLPNQVYKTASNSAAFTLGAASITGGFVEVELGLTGSLAAGAVVTLPTMASVVNLIPTAIANQSWKLRLIGAGASGSNAFTLANNSWTSFNVSSTSIPQGGYREFLITITNPVTPTMTIQGVGGATL